MTAEPQRRDMSLVPYSSRDSREVVFRHNDAVVVYDPQSRQLVLRGTSPNPAVELSNCPYCHRPLNDGPQDLDGTRRVPNSGVDAGFINPEYFRMLHRSIQTSPESSGPPSPGRQLEQTEQIQSGHPPDPAAAGGSTGDSSQQPSHNIPSTAFSPDFYGKNFVEKGVLGKGGNGVVLKVEHMMGGVSLGHFACKRIPVGDDQEWLKKVLLEVQLLQHLTHQNLVSYHYVWLEDYKPANFGPNVPCVFILQQFCNGGDLQQYVCKPMPTKTTEQLKERMRRRSKGEPEPPENLSRIRRLGFDEIFSFFWDVSSGLNHLHSNGFIHRDLKPSNCLLHMTGKRRSVLVSDFGEVQMENAARKSTGATGTVSYCAPEVLQRVQPGGTFGNFTAKSDVFSLGMILYFMCFGDLPYVNADNIHEENEDLDQLRAEITSWAGFDEERKLRSDLPGELYKHLKRLLSIDPASRPTAEEILKSIGMNESGGFDHGGHQTSPPSLFPGLDSSSRISPVDTPSPAVSGTSSPMPEARFGSARKKLKTPLLYLPRGSVTAPKKAAQTVVASSSVRKLISRLNPPTAAK
ncbi:MAG: putative serine/threonine-protein kinase iks1 [Geoglossum umbratile]|nr:MAG: putative serine/threonine-protein kinase iks1 [Geoglossum umbratile]